MLAARFRSHWKAASARIRSDHTSLAKSNRMPAFIGHVTPPTRWDHLGAEVLVGSTEAPMRA
jgi:hypothetical protein